MARPAICFCAFRGDRPVIGDPPGFVRLRGSVGAGGRNAAADVRALQMALNAVATVNAGAGNRLKLDGKIGPRTIAAIKAVQTRWTRVHDGRADPGGPTIRVLNRLAGLAGPVSPNSAAAGKRIAAAPAPPPDPAELAALARLERAQTIVMPVAVVAIVATARMLTEAIGYASTLGPRPPPDIALRSPGRLAFLFAAKHFRLSEADPATALLALRFVALAFFRMIEVVRSRTLTTPKGPRFDRLYALAVVPPQVAGVTNIAYVGTISGALTPGQPDGSGVPDPASQTSMPEFCDGVYLLPGFDTLVAFQVPILIHELAHLCGGPGPETAIADFNSSLVEPAYTALPTQFRLTNVRCYEIMASELLMGTAVARALYGPMLWTTVPPASLGGSRLVAPAAAPGRPDPIRFPVSFA